MMPGWKGAGAGAEAGGGAGAASGAASGPHAIGIELRAVDKMYDAGTHAVRSLDLRVAEGELLVLLGPSGCGKSTVLRLVAGLEPLTSGEIRIADRRVDAVPARDRDVAMVFQSYALYGHMTVRGNLEFPLRMKGVGRDERRRRAEAVADLLELGPILGQKPAALSGGQQQRVAMGRALVREPKAFLLDEPLSNLDARLRSQVRVHIAELQARLGVTTLYVTHDQVEALALGHRIAVLRGGRLQQVGTGAELYERPANAFVARFVGQPGMNLVRGRLRRQDERWTVDIGPVALEVPAEDAGRLAAAHARGGLGAASDGRSSAVRSAGHHDAGATPSTRPVGIDVLVGLRPEALELLPPGSDGAPAGGEGGPRSTGSDTVGVPGEVRTVEAIGPSGVAYVATDLVTVDAGAENAPPAAEGEGRADTRPDTAVDTAVDAAVGAPPVTASGPLLAVRTDRAGRLAAGDRVVVRAVAAAVRLFAADGSAPGG